MRIIALTLIFSLTALLANAQIQEPKKEQQEPEKKTIEKPANKCDKKVKKEENSNFGSAIFPFFFYPVTTTNGK